MALAAVLVDTCRIVVVAVLAVAAVRCCRRHWARLRRVRYPVCRTEFVVLVTVVDFVVVVETVASCLWARIVVVAR